MFCIKCGKEIADGSKFCKFCGAQIGNGTVGSDPLAGSDTSVGSDPMMGSDPSYKKKGGKGVIAILIAILVFILVGGAIGAAAYIKINNSKNVSSEFDDDDDDSDKKDSKDKSDEEDEKETEEGYLAEPDEEEAEEGSNDGIVINSDKGFCVTVPEAFDGEVEVKEDEWGMAFNVKKCKATGGLLFFVSSMPEEELEDYSDMFDDPIVLGRKDGVVYIMGGPTDCEFDEDTQELYEELYSHMDEVAASFKFLDVEGDEADSEALAKSRDEKENESGSDYEYLDDFKYILEVTGNKIKSEDDLKEEYEAWERGEAYFDIYETSTGLMPKWGIGCVFPFSQYVFLTEDDLEDLSATELRYARNEIYARHGKVFKDQELQDYFESLDWYYPWEDEGDEFEVTDASFNEVELANIKLIKKFEK